MVDKTISIKEATDKELDELLIRLQRESELQSLIRQIQVNSIPNQNGAYPAYETPFPGVSTEKPIESLYHVGTPGMKWGIRKAPLTKEQIQIKQKTYETGAATAKEYGNIAGFRRSRQEDNLSNRKRLEAKYLSDQDLKTIVGRLSMEQQYRNLASKDVNVGRSRMESFLAVSGSLLAIAATGAGLALTIKQLTPQKP